LFFGEVQFLADYRHQRSEPEPAEETQEKGQPRHMKRAHGHASEIEQTHSRRFLANVHVNNLLV
jgi:hypothetical protein